MAHLFLATKLSMPDDGKGCRLPRSSSSRIPNSFSSDKLSNHSKGHSVTAATRYAPPHSAELRLSAATGGSEASCWRCLLPFGAVLLVAGAMLTAVGFGVSSGAPSRTDPSRKGSSWTGPSRMGLLGLGLLGTATLLLGSSALFWRLSRSRKKKKDKRRESQAALVQHAHTVA